MVEYLKQKVHIILLELSWNTKTIRTYYEFCVTGTPAICNNIAQDDTPYVTSINQYDILRFKTLIYNT